MMGDFKSKLPDLKELTSMSSKLFHGLKGAVTEIIHDYKEKRAEQEAQEKADEALKAKEAPVEAAAEAPVVVKPAEPEKVIAPEEIHAEVVKPVETTAEQDKKE